MLAYPDYTQPFLLYTDASNVGLGAALMQLDDRGKQQPLAYASRTLNKAETNYLTTHLGALAVVWALKHFCQNEKLTRLGPQCPSLELKRNFHNIMM